MTEGDRVTLKPDPEGRSRAQGVVRELRDAEARIDWPKGSGLAAWGPAESLLVLTPAERPAP